MLEKTDQAAALAARLADKTARIGVIGLGYVGLPLVRLFARAGFATTGFDIDPAKIDKLAAGRSYIGHIGDDEIRDLLDGGRFAPTADFDRLAEMDAIIIAVPTPITEHRDPDLSAVTGTVLAVAARLKAGQLVVLESTTYPGTTDEVVRPILEGGGLVAGTDFFLAYSPERESPGEGQETAAIPKIIGADDATTLELAKTLYGAVVDTTVPVPGTRIAEAAKITENIFRSVNIALVNELKVIYDAMGVDVWEVIDAASSKPFGYMPFYPGPGLGGHCIPVDPFYLAWKAREYGVPTRFVELAGEINVAMPRYVFSRLTAALGEHRGKPVNGARLLVIGIAYKPDVDDTRESPALELIEIAQKAGAEVSFVDPHVPVIPPTRRHPDLAGLKAVELTPETLEASDAVLIVTNHAAVDYALIAEHAPLVVDTRNAMAAVEDPKAVVVKA